MVHKIALICMLGGLLCLPWHMAKASTQWIALVIGNGHYENLPSLPNRTSCFSKNELEYLRLNVNESVN